MLAIYKKEVQSFLHSVTGFLFMAATLFLFGIYLVAYNLVNAYPNLSYAVQSMLFLFLLSVPVLTMRILADERHQKTDQLMLTAPVSIGQIVMGKFLACVTIFIIPVAIMSVMPLLLNHFGEFRMQESYTAILGYILYGAACIAIGLFISSLTENIIVSAVLSFIAIFLLYMMDGLCSLFSSANAVVLKILNAFNFYANVKYFMNGTLNLKAVVYFISVIVLMLFFTTQSIQKRRYSVSVKNFSMGAFSTTAVVIVTAIVVIVNFAAAKLPTKYTEFDVTSNQVYSIGQQTKDMLASLNQDVTIYVYAKESSTEDTVKENLKRYEDGSSYIHVTYVDPVTNPQFASQYGSDGQLSTQSIVVVSGDKSKVIEAGSMYQQEMDYQTYSYQTTGYDGEGQLTSAIARVTSDNTEKIYAVEGHKEYALETSFSDGISKANIDYESLSLLTVDAVPEDAAALIIPAPSVDYSAEEAQKVIDYAQNGGKVLMTMYYTGQSMPNFYKILDYFGLSAQEGYVLDNNQSNYVQQQIYLLPTVASSDVTSSLVSDNRYVLVPYAEGIQVPESDDTTTYTKLLTTSDQGFVKTDVTDQNIQQQENDIAGPVCVGVKAEKTIDTDTKAVAYVFSSLEIFTEQYSQAVAGGNLELFTNIISAMSNQENNVSIAAKSFDNTYRVFNQGYVVLIGFAFTIGIPLILLITGFVIWFRRRKR